MTAPHQRAGRRRRPRARRPSAAKKAGKGSSSRSASPYHSGRRSPAWRKLKLLKQQEFVVGGWTEPRPTRPHFGALLLGVLRQDASGGTDATSGIPAPGFDQKELARVSKLLKAREARPIAVRGRDQDQRAGALGAPRARRAGAVHRVDRRRQAAPPGVSRPAGRQAGGGRGAREKEDRRGVLRRTRRQGFQRRPWRP